MVKVKVCTVCGDRGFTDLLVTCNQCNDLAEHVYCMQTLSEYVPEADWFCVECKLKQKASTHTISLMPSLPLVKQSQAESNKRKIEDTNSIPVSKKRAVESSNGKSLLQRDSSLVSLEGARGDICAVSQHIDISLHSRDGPAKVLQIGKFDCGTTLLQDNGSSQHCLCTDNSPNILLCQPSSSSMTEVASVLTSSGSKTQLLDKSQDPSPPFLVSSRPAASSSVRPKAFKSSKELGSGGGNSSLHDKFSELKSTFEHGNKLKELVPAIDRKNMEITEDGAKLIKENTQGSELGKNPKDSTSLGVEREDCRGLMPKVKSTGSSSNKLKLDKNDCRDPISLDVLKWSKSVHDDHQTLASSNGVCHPRTAGLSNVATVEKALTKTLHRQSISQPSTVYLPDTVAPFLDQLNSEENSTVPKHEIDKGLSCSADKGFQEKQNNVKEQVHESDNSTILQKTSPVYVEGRKLDANAGALHGGARRLSNGHYESLLNTGDNPLKPGATMPAPINFSQERGVAAAEMAHSMTRSLEINLPSSSVMQNDPSFLCERDGMPGSSASSMHISSIAHLQHQKPLTIPQSQILWKGAFKVMGSVCGHCIYDGIQAHPSNTASPKVYQMAKRFSPQLHLEQVNRCDAWPKRFYEAPPIDDNIGLYFFPTDDERCQKSYAKLMKETNNHDLAMRMYLDSAELLIFSSIQLAERFQSIRGKFYFWGVFRGRGNCPSVCKVQEILSPSKHVGANVLQADSSVPSVTRVLMLTDVHKDGVGEEHEKQDFEHFQAESDWKSEAGKETFPRSQRRAYLSREEGSSRKHADGPQNSHQSSLSSGRSDHSYGSKGHSVSPLALGKKKYNRFENAIVREYGKVRKGRHRYKWSRGARINFKRTAHQRRKHDDVNNRVGSRSLSGSHSFSSRSQSESWSELSKRSCCLSVGNKPRSPDARIVVPCHTVNSPYSYLHKRNSHEKPLLQRDSSSEGQIDNRKYNDKARAVAGGDNCRKNKKETSSEKRVEGISLLDAGEGFSVKSPEGSAGQDQPTKDQWSFTPLNVTDEAHEKCNVSEVSNAASLLDSRDSMFSGENIPHELTEADLSGVVNPRTEYVPGPGDQYPVIEGGKWYTGSSSEQADPEPVPCLELFPLEEENLGMAKTVVNYWDIDLELGLGRSSSKKRSPVFDCEKLNPDSKVGRQVFSNGSMMECSPCENSLDLVSTLSLSVPHVQK